MSHPEVVRSKLASVLAHLQSLIIDDEKVAERERAIREAAALDACRLRAERLEALGVEFPRAAHKAIVKGTGLRPTTSLRAVDGWLSDRNRKPILVLVGETGCSKSVAAGWAVANYTRAVAWCSAAELVRAFAGGLEHDAKRIRRRVMNARLTVLDDVGTEAGATAHAIMGAALVEILEARTRRDTLITTNLSPGSLNALYPDPRLHSRLKLADFVPDNGPDLRGTT